MSEEAAAANSPLESFFDLVYVLAFTQVTALLSAHLSWTGMVQAGAVLAALWWTWVSYSWLTDTGDAHHLLLLRLLVLSGAAAIGLASLALPQAFGEGSLLFAAGYLAARLLHFALYWLTTREDSRTRRAILRLSPGLLGGPALVFAGCLAHGWARPALWGAGLLVDYAVPALRGVQGLTVHARHFAERHDLVVILALGESIAAMGAAHPEITRGTAAAALLALVLSASLWWAYFDYASAAARIHLEEAEEGQRARLARDAYSYLHLPIVAGIVFLALGVKKTIAHVDQPLETIAAVALCGGTALYLIGLDAFRLRMTGTVRVVRLVSAALACAIGPAMVRAPALAMLAATAALVTGLVAYETLLPDQFRRTVMDRESPQ